MLTEQLTRVFAYGSLRLPDPGAHLSVEEVKGLYCAAYPELASAVIEGPVAKGKTLRWDFRKAVGTKG